MFHRHAQLPDVTSKLFDMFVVSSNGVLGKLRDLGGETLSLGHLTRPHSRALLVEYVLNFDREDLTKLVKLLSTCEEVICSLTRLVLRFPGSEATPPHF